MTGPVEHPGRRPLATYGIIAAGLWPQTAYCMILYLTGLNAVDPEQIEAARLDGAKGLEDALVHHPAATEARHLHRGRGHVIGALRSFDLVSIMTDGGPSARPGCCRSTCMSRRCRNIGYRMGYGAAIAVILFSS
jgi:multiple sugar transport system permease protein